MDRREARVDHLIDENGAMVEVPDNSRLKVATDAEQTVGATGPNNWWRIGLVAIAALVILLFALQLIGGPPTTEVIPGTPQSAPVNTEPAA